MRYAFARTRSLGHPLVRVTGDRFRLAGEVQRESPIGNVALRDRRRVCGDVVAQRLLYERERQLRVAMRRRPVYTLVEEQRMAPSTLLIEGDRRHQILHTLRGTTRRHQLRAVTRSAFQLLRPVGAAQIILQVHLVIEAHRAGSVNDSRSTANSGWSAGNASTRRAVGQGPGLVGAEPSGSRGGAAAEAAAAGLLGLRSLWQSTHVPSATAAVRLTRPWCSRWQLAQSGSS